eukprot:scaffold353_cov201-Alexandrium_tamarense.AAC.2
MSTLLIVSYNINITYNHTCSLYHFTHSDTDFECYCEESEEGFTCNNSDGVFTDAQDSTCKRSAKARKGRTGDRGSASANIFSPED